MTYSPVNFTTSETPTNSTTRSIGLISILDICAYCIDFCFGIPIHSYIIYFIVSGAGSGVAVEFFILNLSVCDIINSLTCLLCIFPECFPVTFTLPVFLLGLVYSGHPLFQCVICVERYLAVVHPVIFLKFKPLRYRMICCAVAWIITLGSCFYSLFSSTSKSEYVYIWYFLVQFLLLLSIQLFCLVAVLRALKQSGPGERRREEENHMKRRAFYFILITTVSMTIIYVPYIFTGFFAILSKENISSLWLTSLICYVLSSFVQPVLYLQRVVKWSFFSSS